jgi:hypothetical protein
MSLTPHDDREVLAGPHGRSRVESRGMNQSHKAFAFLNIQQHLAHLASIQKAYFSVIIYRLPLFSLLRKAVTHRYYFFVYSVKR